LKASARGGFLAGVRRHVSLNLVFAMRLSKIFVATLALASCGLLFSGCSSPSAGRTGDTVVLGGLYSSQSGAFSQQTSTGIPANSDDASRNKRMSGDKVSILWGLFTYRDQ
jgi:hypothetical protein